MPRATCNGIDLEYEIRGEGAPLVLIMGIGAQMVHWPEGMLDELEKRGFQLILFDNRDAGKSTWFDNAEVPNVMRTTLRGYLGLKLGPVPYTLVDMADDVAGLLDVLELDQAHVLGVSLGGMVAQTFAISHPGRVKTLTSVMSTTGSRWVARSRPRAIRALMTKPPRSEDEAVEAMIRFRRVCGSTGFPFERELHADIARRSWRRGYNPRGFARQLAAVIATGDRTHALRFVRAPSLVVHGKVDPLIPVSGGRATARAIPGAHLHIIDGLGHDLPRAVWPMIADDVAELARLPQPCFSEAASATLAAY